MIDEHLVSPHLLRQHEYTLVLPMTYQSIEPSLTFATNDDVCPCLAAHRARSISGAEPVEFLCSSSFLLIACASCLYFEPTSENSFSAEYPTHRHDPSPLSIVGSSSQVFLFDIRSNMRSLAIALALVFCLVRLEPSSASKKCKVNEECESDSDCYDCLEW